MISERPVVLSRDPNHMSTDRGPLGPVFGTNADGKPRVRKTEKRNIDEKAQCDVLRSSQFHYLGCRSPLHDKRMRLNRKGKKGG